MREPELVSSKRKPFLILKLSRQQKDLNITPPNGLRVNIISRKGLTPFATLQEDWQACLVDPQLNKKASEHLQSIVPQHSDLKGSQEQPGMKRFVGAALPNGVKPNKIYYGKLT